MNALAVSIWLCLALPGAVAIQEAQPAPQNEKADPKKKLLPDEKNAAEKKENVSEADQIIRLQRSLDADTKTLEKTKKDLDDPNGEYHQAEDAFKKVEAALEQKRMELEKFKAKEPKGDTSKLTGEIAALEKQRTLARDRFEVALKEQKIMQERTALLAVKIEKTRRALEESRASPPG